MKNNNTTHTQQEEEFDITVQVQQQPSVQVNLEDQLLQQLELHRQRMRDDARQFGYLDIRYGTNLSQIHTQEEEDDLDLITNMIKYGDRVEELPPDDHKFTLSNDVNNNNLYQSNSMPTKGKNKVEEDDGLEGNSSKTRFKQKEEINIDQNLIENAEPKFLTGTGPLSKEELDEVARVYSQPSKISKYKEQLEETQAHTEQVREEIKEALNSYAEGFLGLASALAGLLYLKNYDAKKTAAIINDLLAFWQKQYRKYKFWAQLGGVVSAAIGFLTLASKLSWLTTATPIIGTFIKLLAQSSAKEEIVLQSAKAAAKVVKGAAEQGVVDQIATTDLMAIQEVLNQNPWITGMLSGMITNSALWFLWIRRFLRK